MKRGPLRASFRMEARGKNDENAPFEGFFVGRAMAERRMTTRDTG